MLDVLLSFCQHFADTLQFFDERFEHICELFSFHGHMIADWLKAWATSSPCLI